MKNFNQFINESIRDLMKPKSKEEIALVVKKIFNLDDNYIEVKIPDVKSNNRKKLNVLLEYSEKYNLDIKDYDSESILICGYIIDVIEFLKIYLNYIGLNKRNSKTFYIEYILKNKINKNLNEGIRDKMTPKTKEEIRKSLEHLGRGNKLLKACKMDILWLVKELVEDGIDVNIKGGYALELAIINNHINIVEYLINNGAYIMDNHLYLAKGLNYNKILDLLSRNKN